MGVAIFRTNLGHGGRGGVMSVGELRALTGYAINIPPSCVASLTFSSAPHFQSLHSRGPFIGEITLSSARTAAEHSLSSRARVGFVVFPQGWWRRRRRGDQPDQTGSARSCYIVHSMNRVNKDTMLRTASCSTLVDYALPHERRGSHFFGGLLLQHHVQLRVTKCFSHLSVDDFELVCDMGVGMCAPYDCVFAWSLCEGYLCHVD